VRAAVARGRESEQRTERALVRALVMVPEIAPELAGEVTAGDFEDPAARAVWSWLLESPHGLPGEEPAASLVRELLADAPDDFDWGAEARGAARRLVERRLRRQLREREEALRKTGETQEASRLMEEIQAIARSLHERTA
jgi:hypothetical protein